MKSALYIKAITSIVVETPLWVSLSDFGLYIPIKLDGSSVVAVG